MARLLLLKDSTKARLKNLIGKMKKGGTKGEGRMPEVAVDLKPPTAQQVRQTLANFKCALQQVFVFFHVGTLSPIGWLETLN